MTTIQDIISHVESLTGHPINRDEGVHFGPSERDVTGATRGLDGHAGRHPRLWAGRPPTAHRPREPLLPV